MSVHEVADEVGVSVGTLYNDFGSKQGLIASAADRLQSNVLGGPEKELGSVTPEQELRALNFGMDSGIDGYQFQLVPAAVPLACFRQPEAVSATFMLAVRCSGKGWPPVSRKCWSGVLAEKVFEVSDPEDTAARVVDAFSDYWLPLGFAEREPDQVMAIKYCRDYSARNCRPRLRRSTRQAVQPVRAKMKAESTRRWCCCCPSSPCAQSLFALARACAESAPA